MSAVGVDAATLRQIVTAAVAAPSIHNTQPWTFLVERGAIDVYLDSRRGLDVADPTHRSQIISCGAAVFDMRVAAAYAGLAVTVQSVPDPERPDLVARIVLGAGPEPDPQLASLFPAIADRHTYRGPFDPIPLTPAVRAELSLAARSRQAALDWVDLPYRRRFLQELAAEAGRFDAYDAARREERARWIGGERQGDGVPAQALHPGGQRSAHPARDLSADPHERLLGPLRFETDDLAVLHTPGDRPADWLAAGEALQQVLLIATRLGISASFLNAPLEYAELRWLVREPAGPHGHPHMLLRMGYPAAGPTWTPRRPIDHVLVDRSGSSELMRDTPDETG